MSEIGAQTCTTAATAAVESASASAPDCLIRQLPAHVVNRIAAGEVIHRPANALKELIENSIDAHAQRITIGLAQGGLSQLHITDNGCGVQARDLPLLCQRFATSKLRNYEELRSGRIRSFGFRGEALASISHCAHVTVTTATRNSDFAYKARYADGQLVEQPSPCAGQQGTQIVVEQLFYNVPMRRQALQNPNEEFARCVDVVCRYAIEYSGIAMICRKMNDASAAAAARTNNNNRADVATLAGASQVDNLRQIYGAQLARELLRLDSNESIVNHNSSSSKSQTIAESMFSDLTGRGARVHGYMTNANYSQSKKLVLILFINRRLVESATIRRLVDSVYASLLPRGAHPFVYLSLHLPSETVDINVHPTKKEVHFLDEDLVLSMIDHAMRRTLEGANQSRTFTTQTIMTSASQHHSFADQNALQLRSKPQLTQSDSLNRPSESQLDSSQRDATTPTTKSNATARQSLINSPVTAPTSQSGSKSRLDMFAANEIQELIDVEAQDDQDDSQTQQDEKLIEQSATPASQQLQTPLLPSSVTVAAPLDDVRRRIDAMTSSNALRSAVGLQPIRTISTRDAKGNKGPARNNDNPAYRPSKLVRTDAQQNRLTSYLAPVQREIDKRDDIHLSSQQQAVEASQRMQQAQISKSRREKDLQLNASSHLQLTSVTQLLDEIRSNEHKSARELFRSHTFVGCCSTQHACIQSGTRLYLVNVRSISHAFFYQQVLRRFGQQTQLKLNPAPTLHSLVMLALQSDADSQDDDEMSFDADGDSLQKADSIVQLLWSKAELLSEYFSIQLNSNASKSATSTPDFLRSNVTLTGLPDLLGCDRYVPPLPLLPDFIVALAQNTIWTEEQACFQSIAKTLAEFYQIAEPDLYCHSSDDNAQSNSVEDQEDQDNSGSSNSPSPAEETIFWSIEHSLFPALRRDFAVPLQSASNGDLTQLACLEQLYKIFERC